MTSIGARDLRAKMRQTLFDTYKNDKVIYITNNDTEMAALVPVKYARLIEQIMLKDGPNEKEISQPKSATNERQ